MPGELIARIPKIDLHLHLEGSLPAATLARLARRHHLPVPQPRRFSGFGGFLKAFGAICDLLVDADDFETAALDLFSEARRLGVIHLEVLFSPQVHLRRGVTLDSIMTGLTRARQRAMSVPGFSAVFIADGVRQWGGGWFEQVVNAMAPWAGHGLTGIGVGGDERSIPAREFVAAYRRARALGLHTTIHAGEAVGPASVLDAVSVLDVERIGHGFRAVEDPGLVRLLRRRGIALEICLSSNLATGLVSSFEAHPARALLEAGVLVTINTDDGAFFGTNIEKELRLAREHLNLTMDGLRGLLIHAAGAAFVPAYARRGLARRIRQAWPASTKGESRREVFSRLP